MTPEEQKAQEEKDRYRFSGDRWTDNGKSEQSDGEEDFWTVPVNSDYTRHQPVWWGKKAISKL